jgi:hypothetical protein
MPNALPLMPNASLLMPSALPLMPNASLLMPYH